MGNRKRVVTVGKIVLPPVIKEKQWHICGNRYNSGCRNEVPIDVNICSECNDQNEYDEHMNEQNQAIQDDYKAIRKLEKSIGKGRLSLGEIQDAQHQIDYLEYHIETLTK